MRSRGAHPGRGSIGAGCLRPGTSAQQLRVAYLLISHDLAVVQQVTDDTIVMHHGQILESGPTDTILREPANDYTRQLLAAVPCPGWQPSRRARPPA